MKTMHHRKTKPKKSAQMNVIMAAAVFKMCLTSMFVNPINVYI